MSIAKALDSRRSVAWFKLASWLGIFGASYLSGPERLEAQCAFTPPTPPSEPGFAFAANGDSDSVTECASNNAGPYCLHFDSEDAWQASRPSFWIEEDSTRTRHRSAAALATTGVTCHLDGPCAQPAHGNGMLNFEGYPSNNSSMDRLELSLSKGGGSESTVLQFGEWRYLRFNLMVNTATGMNGPERTITIAQVWQRNSAATATRPAVLPAFNVDMGHTSTTPAGTIDINFTYRNDVGASTFHTENIPKGQWVGFFIAMKPVWYPRCSGDPSARGVILIWRDNKDNLVNINSLDNTRARNWSTTNDSKFKFFWGYRPVNAEGAGDSLTDRFDVRVSMYRNGDGSGSATAQMFTSYWMDDVKLSNQLTLMPGF